MTQTSKKKRISQKDLAVIKKEIKGLATKHPDTLSSKKAVFHMLPEIEEALDNGQTVSEINHVLKKHGIDIEDTTLRTYIREAKSDSSAPKNNAAPAPEPENTQTDMSSKADANVDFCPTKPNIVSKPMDEAEDPSPELTLADEMPAAYAPRQFEHSYDYTDFDNALGDSTQDSTPVKDE
jgi:hypothetical protein